MSMNFFPMTLIEMIKDRNLIVDKISEQQEDKKAAWFLSKEGETAYKEAKTPGQKTLYFYDYLCSICKRNKFSLEKAEERKKLIKIANILANAIENSFLDFGKYPDILMPEKNPIIKCVKDKELRFIDAKDLVLSLPNNTSGLFANAKDRPYSHITLCEPDGSMSDMRKLEMTILGVFYSDDTYMPPYIYDIVDSNLPDDTDEDSDDDLEEYDDE